MISEGLGSLKVASGCLVSFSSPSPQQALPRPFEPLRNVSLWFCDAQNWTDEENKRTYLIMANKHKLAPTVKRDKRRLLLTACLLEKLSYSHEEMVHDISYKFAIFLCYGYEVEYFPSQRSRGCSTIGTKSETIPGLGPANYFSALVTPFSR